MVDNSNGVPVLLLQNVRTYVVSRVAPAVDYFHFFVSSLHFFVCPPTMTDYGSELLRRQLNGA